MLAGILLAGAIALALASLAGRLPPELWFRAFFRPEQDDMAQLLVHHSILPRMIVALLAGAALGIAGVVFQQVLQNPLAEPATLGVSSSSYLSLAVGSLWLSPTSIGREALALLGAALAAVLILALVRRRLSPLSIVLAGLVVNAFCGSIATVLTIFNFEYLTSLLIWGSGSLAQNDWSQVGYLLPRLGIGLFLALLMARPLALLDLGEAGAASLGLPIGRVRAGALLLAVFLSATVVSAVGTIGFIGLAAPLIVRLTGQRGIMARLLWSTLFGALLLFLADQGVQALAGARGERLPTGIATALLGSALIFELARRRSHRLDPPMGQASEQVRFLALPRRVLAAIALIFLMIPVAAVMLGRGDDGWEWSFLPSAVEVSLRLPRVTAALAAGAMLGVAGVLTQRLTGNPIAGPEVLGIGSAATLGAIMAAMLPGGASRSVQFMFASAGAALVLAIMVASSRRHLFAPQRLLLTGVAAGSFVSGVVALLVVSGDPRAVSALSWMAGSTYRVGAGEAVVATATLFCLLAVLPLILRWLAIVPLGVPTMRKLGVPIGASRLAMLLIAGLFTAAGTLLIGPLSFIGVMAPHLARLSGFFRAAPQLAAAAAIGAAVMVVADWLGRNLLFPWEIPAGVVAAVISAPYLIYLLRRLS